MNVRNLGLALGITSGILIVIVSILANLFGIGGDMVTVMGSIYPGYALTVVGTFIGVIWGFIDGFVVGVILATVYNKLEG